MIDPSAGDGHDGRSRGSREDRDQKEDRMLRPPPANGPGDGGDKDVAHAVPDDIPRKPGKQRLWRHKSQRDRRHCWREDGAQYRHHHIGCENHRQNGRLLDGERTDRKKDGRANQDRTLAPGSVNHRPGRNMKANADQARDGEHNAHLRCGPASGCDQKHADKGSQPALHIGQEKVYGV
jgi:hypothetical protein